MAVSNRASIPLLLSLCVLCPPAGVAAQLRDRTAPVLTPGALLGATDDALAVDVDPAALAFLPAWSAVYVHAQADPDAQPLRGGDGVWLASPIAFGFAGGLSVQSIRPTSTTGEARRAMASLALGYAPSRRLAAGASVHFLGSRDGTLDGVTTLDLGISLRPSPSLALSLVGRDLNGPLGVGGAELPASFLLAVSLRPTGTHALTLDVGGALDSAGRVGVRGAVDLRVPYIGRAVASAELAGLEESDPVFLLTAGLEVQWGSASAGGGVVLGDRLGHAPGWYVTGRLSGARRDGLPQGRHVADVAVRDALGARGLLSLIRRLDLAEANARVAGVLLRFRGSGMGSAYAQEVRWAITRLRQAGKPVVCHLDAASGAELYACAAATRTYIDPAGGARLTGPSGTFLLLGDLLRRAGVRADFVRIGRFKSAPEQLTNRRSSEGAREQREVLYDDVYRRLVADLSRDMDADADRVREIIDEGPYLTPELIRMGWIAGAGDELALDEQLEDAFGGSYALREETPAREPRRWGRPGRVGVVVVDGDIIDGDNLDLPFVGVHMSGGRTVARAVEALAADSSVRAIVLRVDSPGGSALASDQIWRAVRRARRRKPVICSMGAIAASGGYYVASAADEIWADPSTLTGSIGIFFGKVDVTGLAARLGVGIERVSRGRHAGVESIYRPFTPEERALVARKIRIWYRLFLRRISEGRAMDVGALHSLAQGRVWSGDAALRRGLVDRLGGFGAALARARQLAHLDRGAEIIIVPPRPSSLLDYVLGTGAGAAAAQPAPDVLGPELSSALQMGVALGHVRAGIPLARLPFVVTPP